MWSEHVDMGEPVLLLKDSWCETIDGLGRERSLELIRWIVAFKADDVQFRRED